MSGQYLCDPPERPRRHDVDKVGEHGGNRIRFQTSNREGWAPTPTAATAELLFMTDDTMQHVFFEAVHTHVS